MGPAMNDRRARTQRRGLHRGCPLRRSGWLEGATEYRYDVLILELMLRDQGDSTPIPVLTAKDGEYDETEALDSGADDYRTKPFSFPVLIARLRALLRRTSGGALAPTQVGDLRLDPARRRCWRGGGHELLVVHRMAATMLSPASTWQPWVAIRSTRPGRPGAPSSRTVTLRACQGAAPAGPQAGAGLWPRLSLYHCERRRELRPPPRRAPTPLPADVYECLDHGLQTTAESGAPPGLCLRLPSFLEQQAEAERSSERAPGRTSAVRGAFSARQLFRTLAW